MWIESDTVDPIAVRGGYKQQSDLNLDTRGEG